MNDEPNLIMVAQAKITEAEKALQAVAKEIARGTGGREIALSITKVQEAQHWLTDAIIKQVDEADS
jgi:hypothetical protein